jgi:hypothetical protein
MRSIFSELHSTTETLTTQANYVSVLCCWASCVRWAWGEPLSFVENWTKQRLLPPSEVESNREGSSIFASRSSTVHRNISFQQKRQEVRQNAHGPRKHPRAREEERVGRARGGERRAAGAATRGRAARRGGGRWARRRNVGVVDEYARGEPFTNEVKHECLLSSSPRGLLPVLRLNAANLLARCATADLRCRDPRGHANRAPRLHPGRIQCADGGSRRSSAGGVSFPSLRPLRWIPDAARWTELLPIGGRELDSRPGEEPVAMSPSRTRRPPLLHRLRRRVGCRCRFSIFTARELDPVLAARRGSCSAAAGFLVLGAAAEDCILQMPLLCWSWRDERAMENTVHRRQTAIGLPQMPIIVGLSLRWRPKL